MNTKWNIQKRESSYTADPPRAGDSDEAGRSANDYGGWRTLQSLFFFFFGNCYSPAFTEINWLKQTYPMRTEMQFSLLQGLSFKKKTSTVKRHSCVPAF